MSKPLPPPSVPSLLSKVLKSVETEGAADKFLALSEAAKLDTSYRPWDAVFHMDPPNGLTTEEWWLGIKIARRSAYRTLPLRDATGHAFVYALPDPALELLHYIDQRASGEVVMPEDLIGEKAAQQQFLVNSLMEEAIRSSQLEGAVTTRRVAKEMIRTGREPTTRGERMILNNYRALEYMRDGAGQHLTPEVVLEFHRILTAGTLENPDAAGRLQRPDEERVSVCDRNDGSVLHTPPPAEQLPGRLEQMCSFANGESQDGSFLHPVVRAIALHFWLAHDHPFEDGNGRTARALFYWSMRTSGYWATEYLSISRILRERPAKYNRSFLYTETDDNDATYFLLDQLTVIKRAIEEFHSYLRRKTEEIRDFEESLGALDGLNYRQMALLKNAVRNPSQRYTFRSHQRSHGVSFESARSDLRRLADRGLLEMKRTGRRFVFTPAPTLRDSIGAGPTASDSR